MGDRDVNALIERWMNDINDRGHDRFKRTVRKFLGCHCYDSDEDPCNCIADPAVTQDDLVGNAMLKLLEKSSEYKASEGNSIDAWAVAVIRNCLTDSLRDSTRQRPDGSEFAKPMPGPTGDTISTEFYNEFERYEHDPEDFRDDD